MCVKSNLKYASNNFKSWTVTVQQGKNNNSGRWRQQVYYRWFGNILKTLIQFWSTINLWSKIEDNFSNGLTNIEHLLQTANLNLNHETVNWKIDQPCSIEKITKSTIEGFRAWTRYVPFFSFSGKRVRSFESLLDLQLHTWFLQTH